jgi:tetratricopeptide (TPR) repeat protein
MRRVLNQAANAAVKTILLTTTGAALAQSNPFDGLDTRGRAYSDPALYATSKAQWLARVEAMPENVDVLEGAADFLAILDRPLALELLERASALEPNNPKWVQRLAQTHRLNAGSGDVAEAQTALSLMERASAMSPAAEQATVLTNLPAMAFDAGEIRKARAYAERLLDASKSEHGG